MVSVGKYLESGTAYVCIDKLIDLADTLVDNVGELSDDPRVVGSGGFLVNGVGKVGESRLCGCQQMFAPNCNEPGLGRGSPCQQSQS